MHAIAIYDWVKLSGEDTCRDGEGISIPILFSTKAEICEQNCHSGCRKWDNASCEGEESKCIVRSWCKKARKNKIQFYKCGAFRSQYQEPSQEYHEVGGKNAPNGRMPLKIAATCLVVRKCTYREAVPYRIEIRTQGLRYFGLGGIWRGIGLTRTGWMNDWILMVSMILML